MDKSLLSKTIVYDACGIMNFVELWQDTGYNWYEVVGSDVNASYGCYQEAINRFKSLSIDLMAKHMPSV